MRENIGDYEAEADRLCARIHELEEALAAFDLEQERARNVVLNKRLQVAGGHHGLPPDIAARFLLKLGTRHDELLEESVDRVVSERDGLRARNATLEKQLSIEQLTDYPALINQMAELRKQNAVLEKERDEFKASCRAESDASAFYFDKSEAQEKDIAALRQQLEAEKLKLDIANSQDAANLARFEIARAKLEQQLEAVRKDRDEWHDAYLKEKNGGAMIGTPPPAHGFPPCEPRTRRSHERG